MAKTYYYTDVTGKLHEISFLKEKYITKNICITAIEHVLTENGYDTVAEYSKVSINLSDTPSTDCIWCDTTEKAKHLINWMLDNNLLTLTGKTKTNNYYVWHEAKLSRELLLNSETLVPWM